MGLSINANHLTLFKKQHTFTQYSKQNDNAKEKENKNSLSISLNKQDKDKNQNSLMENLLKQKQDLNEQKQSLMAREMDPKEKKYKVEELNKKIQDIEAQIQQLQIQEKQKETEKQQDEMLKKKVAEEKSNPNTDKERDGVIISAGLNELIKLNSSKESMHLLKDSKNREKVEAGYIKPNEDPNSYNNRKLAKISQSIASIDMKVNTQIGDLNKSAERMKAKTELALEQLKDKEKEKADEDNENTGNNETIFNSSEN